MAESKEVIKKQTKTKACQREIGVKLKELSVDKTGTIWATK